MTTATIAEPMHMVDLCPVVVTVGGTPLSDICAEVTAARLLSNCSDCSGKLGFLRSTRRQVQRHRDRAPLRNLAVGGRYSIPSALIGNDLPVGRLHLLRTAVHFPAAASHEAVDAFRGDWTRIARPAATS
ncbi:hypothetical protein ABZS66_54245 [Dactylosporangium sp. NPDC005572]|uniref:hypothetical protein n=1 Tax=Dactylosporangium sp. NPDC005572 TaxID=3156889 RepID=UPI0033BC07CD